MPKAAAGFNTPADRDADLLAMVARHRVLWRRMNELQERDGDDACDGDEYRAVDAEAIDLENRIPVWPVTTSKGSQAKRTFMRLRAEQVEALDRKTLLDTILMLDAERIAAAH